jgi:uncharacterized protein YjbI with pentapeptide repeats
MWEILSKILLSDKTPWIIAAVSAGIGGWWAFKKIQYEKRLEKFKETNANLFKDKKQEVLAAIATLSIFKRNPEFEKNTIDVLLSRLYTELDYDVINSILSTLIQDSNRKELIYIANGLQDINRNFFIQKYPTDQRVNEVNNALLRLDDTMRLFSTPEYIDLVTKGKVDVELFVKNKDKIVSMYEEDFINLVSTHKYKLNWHKRVTADAYGIFLRKAYLANKAKEEELIVNLFQNDFNYVYMAGFKTTETIISRSALASALFAEVEFYKNNISRTDFFASIFSDSGFYHGTIADSIFEKNKFEGIIFRNIQFEKTKFMGCTFNNAEFINCTGLTQEHFINCTTDDSSSFPMGVVIPKTAKEPVPESQAL